MPANESDVFWRSVISEAPNSRRLREKRAGQGHPDGLFAIPAPGPFAAIPVTAPSTTTAAAAASTAGPVTATPAIATTTATTARALFARAGDVHGELPSGEFLAVEQFHRFLRLLRGAELDKRKSA